jgi:hypothetical protein
MPGANLFHSLWERFGDIWVFPCFSQWWFSHEVKAVLALLEAKVIINTWMQIKGVHLLSELSKSGVDAVHGLEVILEWREQC